MLAGRFILIKIRYSPWLDKPVLESIHLDFGLIVSGEQDPARLISGKFFEERERWDIIPENNSSDQISNTQSRVEPDILGILSDSTHANTQDRAKSAGEEEHGHDE